MKTGVILFIRGAREVEADFDIQDAASRLDVKADSVEIVLDSLPCFDVMDAWWRLTAKGMKKVVCILAEVTSGGELRLTGRELRLCG